MVERSLGTCRAGAESKRITSGVDLSLARKQRPIRVELYEGAAFGVGRERAGVAGTGRQIVQRPLVNVDVTAPVLEQTGHATVCQDVELVETVCDAESGGLDVGLLERPDREERGSPVDWIQQPKRRALPGRERVFGDALDRLLVDASRPTLDVHSDTAVGCEGDEHDVSRVRQIEHKAALIRDVRFTVLTLRKSEFGGWPAEVVARQPAKQSVRNRVACTVGVKMQSRAAFELARTEQCAERWLVPRMLRDARLPHMNLLRAERWETRRRTPGRQSSLRFSARPTTSVMLSVPPRASASFRRA